MTTNKINKLKKKRRSYTPLDPAAAQRAKEAVRGAETHQQRENTYAAEGKLLDLPLEKLHLNPLNARVFYDEAIVQERAASLEAEGQLVAIIVVPHPDLHGEYIIVDGEYRFRAAKYNSWTKIRAELKPQALSGLELYKASREANEQRKTQTVLDTAVVWKGLVENGTATRENLSELSEKSAGEVSKILKIADIPYQALSILAKKETPLGVNEAYEVYHVFKAMGDTPEFLEQAQRIADKNLGRSHIEKIRSDLATQEQKTAPVEPRHQFMSPSGKVAGKLDLKGKKISLSYQAESEEDAERISQAIATLMKKEGK